MTRAPGAHPYPIELINVWKRYHLGSQHGSLRDAIPALVKRVTGRNGHDTYEDAGQFWALREVGFHVKRAETLGIIGHNGAGKSTILKLLSRICKQTKGQIHVRGRLAALIEVGAGFHPDLTGRENIYMNGTIMGLRRRDITRQFDSIVAFAELEKFLEMPVKRYSSGMAVRLGFAVAAHVRPEILLIDEVLAVGDLAFQQKCYQRILELKANGTTMIFVSHNLEAVHRICDRIVLLKEGQVKFDGAPEEGITTYRQQTLQKSRVEKVWTPLGIEMKDTSVAMEVVDAHLLDSAGTAQQIFETNDALRLALHYRTNRPIQRPSVTVTIERFDGLICHEASTKAAGISWESWDGEGCMTLEYPNMRLLPNTYYINVAVYEDQNPVAVARLFEPLSFQMTSLRAERGITQLEYRWTLAGHAVTSQGLTPS